MYVCCHESPFLSFTQRLVLALGVWLALPWGDLAHAAEQPLTSQTTATSPTENTRQQHDRRADDSARDKEDGIAKYTRWLTILTGFLVVATLILALPALWQAWIIRGGSQRQLRAYVFIQEGELNDVRDPPSFLPGMAAQQIIATAASQLRHDLGVIPSGHLSIKNSGQTPAYDVRIWAAAPWLDSFPRPATLSSGSMTEYQTQAILPPGGEVHYPIAMNRPLTAEERKALIAPSGGTAVYLSGHISYKDAFGCRWRTHFRLFHSARAAFPEVNKLAVCDEGNWEEHIRRSRRIIDRLSQRFFKKE